MPAIFTASSLTEDIPLAAHPGSAGANTTPRPPVLRFASRRTVSNVRPLCSSWTGLLAAPRTRR